MSNQKKKKQHNYLTIVDNGKLIYEYGSLKRDLFVSIYGIDKYKILCHKIYNLSKPSADTYMNSSFWGRHTKRVNFIIRIKYKL